MKEKKINNLGIFKFLFENIFKSNILKEKDARNINQILIRFISNMN
jgi:hypothetical protein